MSRWNQPICERCWIEQSSEWDGDRLISVRQAVRVVTDDIERCSYCGEPTIWGAYVRDDPATVPFPPEPE